MKRLSGKYAKQKCGESPWLKPGNSPHGGVSSTNPPLFHYGHYHIPVLGILLADRYSNSGLHDKGDFFYSAQPRRLSPPTAASTGQVTKSIPSQRPQERRTGRQAPCFTAVGQNHSQTSAQARTATNARENTEVVPRKSDLGLRTRSALTQTNQTTHR
jgi:hypothetical protein